MIATSVRLSAGVGEKARDEQFLTMLPRIRAQASWAFRRLPAEARAEAMQEVVASTFVAFSRLAEQGRANQAQPASLARYAVKRFRVGRRVSCSAHVGDVMSPYAQCLKGIRVESLQGGTRGSTEWQEILVEDKTVTPADLAASRVDYPAFLATLSVRDRQIAEQLAIGEPAARIAQRFSLTPARISQLRRELRDAWLLFHGEKDPNVAVVR